MEVIKPQSKLQNLSRKLMVFLLFSSFKIPAGQVVKLYGERGVWCHPEKFSVVAKKMNSFLPDQLDLDLHRLSLYYASKTFLFSSR